MSDWFFMLGEPLAASEQAQVRQYLAGLGIEDDLPIEGVPNWESAGQIVKNPEWDRRWWDAEQREQKRLYGIVNVDRSQGETSKVLSRTLEFTEAVHGAAAVQAARRGCADAALIRVAAGAASQALHLAELARLAGAGQTHPFSIKASLFAGGHWPLGIANGRYYVF